MEGLQLCLAQAATLHTRSRASCRVRARYTDQASDSRPPPLALLGAELIAALERKPLTPEPSIWRALREGPQQLQLTSKPQETPILTPKDNSSWPKWVLTTSFPSLTAAVDPLGFEEN